MKCDLCDKEADMLTGWRLNDNQENTILICGECRAKFAKDCYGIKRKKKENPE